MFIDTVRRAVVVSRMLGKANEWNYWSGSLRPPNPRDVSVFVMNVHQRSDIRKQGDESLGSVPTDVSNQPTAESSTPPSFCFVQIINCVFH